MKTFAAALLASIFAVLAIGGEDTPKKDEDTPKKDSAKEDLAQAQGKWIQTFEVGGLKRRQIKHIEGNKETVSIYQGEELLAQWTVEFEIKRTDNVKIFTFPNITVTAGEGKGTTTPGPYSYLFQIRDDKWIEVHGLMNNDKGTPSLVTYERMKE